MSRAGARRLYHFRHRWYDPATKQFLSPDPLSADEGGDLNRYGYAGNDPVNRADPEGLDYVLNDTFHLQAYWWVERPGRASLPDLERYSHDPVTEIALGYARGSQLLLNATFGGGAVPYGGG